MQDIIYKNFQLKKPFLKLPFQPDAFRWIPGLLELDLSMNNELFDDRNVSTSLRHLTGLTSIRLESNNLNKIPFDILQTLNGSLTSLNLSFNSFSEINPGEFPFMANLKTLLLDACRIRTIHEGNGCQVNVLLSLVIRAEIKT